MIVVLVEDPLFIALRISRQVSRVDRLAVVFLSYRESLKASMIEDIFESCNYDPDARWHSG